MIGNVYCRPDLIKDNVFPRRKHVDSKIDGAVALIMGIGTWLKTQPHAVPLSLSEGFLTI
jgi:hypothetical protein